MPSVCLAVLAVGLCAFAVTATRPEALLDDSTLSASEGVALGASAGARTPDADADAAIPTEAPPAPAPGLVDLCVEKTVMCTAEKATAWAKVYQIKSVFGHDGFDMNADSVGDVGGSVEVTASAKFSDEDINGLALRKEGWEMVYRLSSPQSTGNTYVRTNAPYNDTGYSFGVGSEAEACFATSYCQCDKKGHATGWTPIEGGRIDNYEIWGPSFNTCDRFAVWGGNQWAYGKGEMCVEGRNCVTGGFKVSGPRRSKEDYHWGNYHEFTLSVYVGIACP